ncbi:MAG TPA: imelysin family protein [Phototrophicaceae bacterium]|nr:imelysin family protein [Phototrophicaceae bacterium]
MVAAQDATPEATAAATAQTVDLSGIKAYTIQQTTALNQYVDALQKDSQAFYDLANAANFDYNALWQNHQDDVIKTLQAAQQDWINLNPQYESMEGIIAGVPSLQPYDPILDSGVQGQVDLDVTLPNGTVLPKPGNLMALTQETLWGTDPTYIVKMKVDFNGNGTQDFGEVMPDAQYAKGFADSLAMQTASLLKSVQDWQPTQTDVFTALVVNVPTMTDFFNSWKESRFVLGDKATRGDFAVTSRLADIHDNVESWEVMWEGLAPAVTAVDVDRNSVIADELKDLQGYIDNLYQQEQGGKRFTPEQADLFSSEAQARATVIVGQISQVAAELNIQLPQ